MQQPSEEDVNAPDLDVLPMNHLYKFKVPTNLNPKLFRTCNEDRRYAKNDQILYEARIQNNITF